MTTATGTAVDANATAIHTRALLVWLRISTWSARRYDKTVTNKVNAQYAASSDAGRYNKHLLPGDNPAYKSLVTIAGSIRDWHYTNTLAWADAGWRLLPTANYAWYTAEYRTHVRAFSTALDAFTADYPNMRANARQLLNGLYKDEDYPTTDDLHSRFSLGIDYMPVPAAGDIRVDLASDQVDAIERTIAERLQAATNEAVRDCWTRLHDVVAHIAERLADPTAIFRDSLIENASDVCQVLERLNVTNDPQLDDMRRRAFAELTRYQPETLRNNPHKRAETATKAQRILDDMSAAFGGVK